MHTLSRKPQLLTSSPQGDEHTSDQGNQPLLSPSSRVTGEKERTVPGGFCHLTMHLLPGLHL